MYLLLKRMDPPLMGYTIAAKSENICDISNDISARVKDGCPIQRLKVVEEIPFEFKCAVKYGEDLRNPDAK